MPADPLPELDENTLAAIREIMEEEFPLLITSYLEEARHLIDQLEAAATGADAMHLQRAAHSLKSASANIGAARLADTARQLELKGRNGDLSGTATLVESAKSLFEGVSSRLAAHAPR